MNTEDFSVNPCEPARIKRWGSHCCPTAIIPLVDVLTDEEIKSLRNCFVHVQTTNRTYYVDNQHRFIICWTGPKFADDYDVEQNPLKLRGQIVFDFKNGRAFAYNNVGESMEIGGGWTEVSAVSDEDWTELFSGVLPTNV